MRREERKGMTDTPAWQPLSRAEEEGAWARFQATFDFPWGIHPGREPTPSITYAIGHAFERDLPSRSALEDDLNRKTRTAFQRCLRPGEKMYALDWQHPCFWFDPHASFDADDRRAWAVPVLPDGDFYVFLPDDCRFCLYGDCINHTLAVYGYALIEAFAPDQPTLFSRVVRIDGEPIS